MFLYNVQFIVTNSASHVYEQEYKLLSHYIRRTRYWTTYTVQSLSWEATDRSDGQEITSLLGNPNVITVFTRLHNWIIFWTRRVQFKLHTLFP